MSTYNKTNFSMCEKNLQIFWFINKTSWGFNLPPMFLNSSAECNLLTNFSANWRSQYNFGQISLHCQNTATSGQGTNVDHQCLILGKFLYLWRKKKSHKWIFFELQKCIIDWGKQSLSNQNKITELLKFPTFIFLLWLPFCLLLSSLLTIFSTRNRKFPILCKFLGGS